jgi:hypothetical protein
VKIEASLKFTVNPYQTDGSAHSLSRAFNGNPHEAVEDQDVTNAEIADLFGPTVASLVAEVTDDKSLPKQLRKDNPLLLSARCASLRNPGSGGLDTVAICNAFLAPPFSGGRWTARPYT